MSEMWIQSSEKILDRIKSLEEVEGEGPLRVSEIYAFHVGRLAKKPVGLDAVGEQPGHHD